MCQQVKRILIKRSREASRRYGGVYVVTICRHDMITDWGLCAEGAVLREIQIGPGSPAHF